MPEAATKNQKKKSGSSSQKMSDGAGGPKPATPSDTPSDTTPPRQRGSTTTGERLCRVLIFLSDTDIAALRKQVGELTPDALVEKPIDPPVLIAKIKELLP